MNTRNDVEKFMLLGDQNVKTEISTQFDSQSKLYFELVKEEFLELTDAFQNSDIVETADACGDLIWVIEGLCHSLGIPLQKVWDEIARSNFSKTVNGQLVKREDGKVLKPSTYSPPNIKQILGN